MNEFQVKMDGEKKVLQSGMTREDKSEKIRFDLIPDWFLWRLAELYTKGSKNHEPRNWEKASTYEDLDLFEQGAYRHFMQFRRGDKDEDHAMQLVFNVIGVLHTQQKIEEKVNKHFDSSCGPECTTCL